MSADVATRPIEINQDHEFDGGELGGPLPVFWAKGHDYDQNEFLRAVLDYCLDNEVDIPAISWEDCQTETWQQNVSVNDRIEYRRDPTPPTSPRSSRFPVTVLDLVEVERRGGPKCGVDRCKEPWASGPSAMVRISPDADPDNLSYMAVRMWFCREHSKLFPSPSYRVCLIPVGATIVFPSPAVAQLRAAEHDREET